MDVPLPSKYLSDKEADAVMRVAEKTMECKCQFAYDRIPREGGARLSVGLHCHAYFLYHLRLPPWCYMVDSISEDLRQFTRAAARREELEKPSASAPSTPPPDPAPVPIVATPLPPPAPPKLGSIKQPRRPTGGKTPKTRQTGGKVPKTRPAPYSSSNYAIEALLYPSGRCQKKAKTSSAGFVRINVLSDEEGSSSSGEESSSSSSSAQLPPCPPPPAPLVFEDVSDFSSAKEEEEEEEEKQEEDSEINSI